MSESDRKSVGISFCMVQKNEKSVIDLGDIKLGVVETYLLNHYMALPFLKEELLTIFSCWKSRSDEWGSFLENCI